MTPSEQYKKETGKPIAPIGNSARDWWPVIIRDYIDWLESNLTRVTGERGAAQELCEIYFNIASEIIGDEELRRRRDAAINRIREGK